MKRILVIFAATAALAVGSISTINPQSSALERVPTPKFGGVPPPPVCPPFCGTEAR